MKNAEKGIDVDRRRLMAAGGMIAVGLAMESIPAIAADAPSAKTAYGEIRGAAYGTVKAFKGVPYGASTDGGNRFMPPQPPAPWTGLLDTTELGHQSPQPMSEGAVIKEEAISNDQTPLGEDCLRLNIWTAGLRDGGKRPVMVWLHGGGFTSGSGGDVHYDGTNLARKRDVVVVTVNHRLNAFGYLYLAGIGGTKYADSGNVGQLDIVAALRWIKDNIAEFGGDAANVTLFGQSGGGGKVTTLMAMPQAAGLFHRAIAQSGLAFKAITAEQATDTAKQVLAKLNLTPNQVDQLQQMPFQKILDAMKAAGPAGNRFGPVMDGRSLVSGNGPLDPVAPALSADVPLLLGSNLTEVTFFTATPVDPIDDATLQADVKRNLHTDDAETGRMIALYKRDYPDASNVRLYQIIASDNWMTANVAVAAERKAAQGKAPAYVYHFEKPTPVRDGKLGVPHTLEICYAFDNLDVPTARDITGSGKERYALADRMSAAWTNFARTGNPDAPGLPHWRPYSPSDRAVMIFNDECKIVADPHPEMRKALIEMHVRQGQISPG